MWNNNQAVGISLIGDFEKEEPTKPMMDSLRNLSVALASYYDIDPVSTVTTHKKTKTDPYLRDVVSMGIA